MKDLKAYITEANEERSVGQYLNESLEQIMEKLITVGGKAYPNFGNVVIMAGGAGSGKGFVKDTLLGVEGKVFDVDELKMLVLRSEKLNEIVRKEFGVDISKFNLRDAEAVGKLHEIVGDKMGLPKGQQDAFLKMAGVGAEDRRPNIIFDVTLKDMPKLGKISQAVTSVGYDKKNIHIVWVVNDIKVAIDQNKERDRVVPHDILVGTHSGAAQTMAALISGSEDVSKYMDGDIWLAFNQKGVDSEVIMGRKDQDPNSQTPIQPMKRGTDIRHKAARPMTITDANIVLIKKAGSPIDGSKVGFMVISKIMEYIPTDAKYVKEPLKPSDFRRRQ